MICRGRFGAAAAKTFPHHGLKVTPKTGGHGKINEKVEEAADHSRHVLNIVEEKVVRRVGVADPFDPSPKTHLKHEIGNVAEEEDDDESQRHLTQITNALAHEIRVVTWS